MREKLQAAETRELGLIEKHRQLQGDHQNLIDIAMELVQCIAKSLTGETVCDALYFRSFLDLW
jgi:hypothetical protein